MTGFAIFLWVLDNRHLFELKLKQNTKSNILFLSTVKKWALVSADTCRLLSGLQTLYFHLRSSRAFATTVWERIVASQLRERTVYRFATRVDYFEYKTFRKFNFRTLFIEFRIKFGHCWNITLTKVNLRQNANYAKHHCTLKVHGYTARK